MRLALIAALLAAGGYQSEIRQWQLDRERSLKADDGWLTVAGLFWLHEGINRVEDLPGTFDLRAGKVTYRNGRQTRDLRPDSPGPADELNLGDRTFFVIRRADRFGIRLRDKKSRYRREFTGLHFFPIQPEYRVTARFVAQTRRIAVLNILGQTEAMESPGYVAFRLRGRDLRLYPVLEQPGARNLFFIFRDQTARRETYGAGRFLYTDLPRSGKVVLDFNKAYNPPCAFTPYATCPLPPAENRLPVRIEAGELKYGAH